jgi:hypothetical protein
MIAGRKRFAGDWAVSDYTRHPVALPQAAPNGAMLSSFLIAELLEIDAANRPSTRRLLGLTQVMELVIRMENQPASPPDQLRSTGLRYAILSNRHDVVGVLLDEIQYLPRWWPAVSTESLALFLEVDHIGIADLIIQAGVSIAQAARYVSYKGYVLAIKRILENPNYDNMILDKDYRGYSCLDYAISYNYAKVAALLYRRRCSFLPSLQTQLLELFVKEGSKWGELDAGFSLDRVNLSPTSFHFIDCNLGQPFWTSIGPNHVAEKLNIRIADYIEFNGCKILQALLSPNGSYLVYCRYSEPDSSNLNESVFLRT